MMSDKKISRRRLQLSAFLVAFIFSWNTITWADGIGSIVPLIKEAKDPSYFNVGDDSTALSLKALFPPQNLGQVKSLFRGNRDSIVVLIQDAHVNEEAQRHLVNIINSLSENHKLKLVGLEGAEGDLYPELFSFFPNQKARREVSDYFLKQGRLTGAEYCAIVNRPKLKLFGIEDNRLYEQNRKAYLDVLDSREKDQAVLKEIHELLSQAARFVFSDHLRELVRRRSSAPQENGGQLFEYVRYLAESLENNHLDIQYPRLRKLYQLIQRQSEINFQKATSELGPMMNALEGSLSAKELPQLYAAAKDFKAKKISKTDYFDRVLRFTQDLNGPSSQVFLEKYADALDYLKYMIDSSRIDASFFDEIPLVEDALLNLWARSEEEKKLAFLFRVDEIYQKMFDFALTKQDAEFFYQHQNEFRMNKFKEFFETVFAKYRFLSSLPEGLEVLDRDFPKTERFYALAAQRDQVLITRALEKMHKSREKIMAVVTGGFHTPGIEKYLRDQDYSYLVITPQMSQAIDEKKQSRLYEEALREKPLPLQQFMNEVLINQRALTDPRYQLTARLILPERIQGASSLGRPDHALAASYFGWIFLASVFNQRSVKDARSEIEHALSLKIISSDRAFLENRIEQLGEAVYRESAAARLQQIFRFEENGEYSVIEKFPSEKRPQTFARKNPRRHFRDKGAVTMGKNTIEIVRGVPDYLIDETITKKFDRTTRSELRAQRRSRPLTVEELEQRDMLSSTPANIYQVEKPLLPPPDNQRAIHSEMTNPAEVSGSPAVEALKEHFKDLNDETMKVLYGVYVGPNGVEAMPLELNEHQAVLDALFSGSQEMSQAEIPIMPFQGLIDASGQQEQVQSHLAVDAAKSHVLEVQSALEITKTGDLITKVLERYTLNGSETVETTEYSYSSNGTLIGKSFIRSIDGKESFSEIVHEGDFQYDAQTRIIGFSGVRKEGDKTFQMTGRYSLDGEGRPQELVISLQDSNGKVSEEITTYEYAEKGAILRIYLDQAGKTARQQINEGLSPEEVKVVKIPDIKNHPVWQPIERTFSETGNASNKIVVKVAHSEEVNHPKKSSGGGGGSKEKETFSTHSTEKSSSASSPKVATSSSSGSGKSSHEGITGTETAEDKNRGEKTGTLYKLPQGLPTLPGEEPDRSTEPEAISKKAFPVPSGEGKETPRSEVAPEAVPAAAALVQEALIFPSEKKEDETQNNRLAQNSVLRFLIGIPSALLALFAWFQFTGWLAQAKNSVTSVSVQAKTKKIPWATLLKITSVTAFYAFLFVYAIPFLQAALASLIPHLSAGLMLSALQAGVLGAAVSFLTFTGSVVLVLAVLTIVGRFLAESKIGKTFLRSKKDESEVAQARKPAVHRSLFHLLLHPIETTYSFAFEPVDRLYQLSRNQPVPNMNWIEKRISRAPPFFQILVLPFTAALSILGKRLLLLTYSTLGRFILSLALVGLFGPAAGAVIAHFNPILVGDLFMGSGWAQSIIEMGGIPGAAAMLFSPYALLNSFLLALIMTVVSSGFPFVLQRVKELRQEAIQKKSSINVFHAVSIAIFEVLTCRVITVPGVDKSVTLWYAAWKRTRGIHFVGFHIALFIGAAQFLGGLSRIFEPLHQLALKIEGPSSSVLSVANEFTGHLLKPLGLQQVSGFNFFPAPHQENPENHDSRESQIENNQHEVARLEKQIEGLEGSLQNSLRQANEEAEQMRQLENSRKEAQRLRGEDDKLAREEKERLQADRNREAKLKTLRESIQSMEGELRAAQEKAKTLRDQIRSFQGKTLYVPALQARMDQLNGLEADMRIRLERAERETRERIQYAEDWRNALRGNGAIVLMENGREAGRYYNLASTDLENLRLNNSQIRLSKAPAHLRSYLDASSGRDYRIVAGRESVAYLRSALPRLYLEETGQNAVLDRIDHTYTVSSRGLGNLEPVQQGKSYYFTSDHLSGIRPVSELSEEERNAAGIQLRSGRYTILTNQTTGSNWYSELHRDDLVYVHEGAAYRVKFTNEGRAAFRSDWVRRQTEMSAADRRQLTQNLERQATQAETTAEKLTTDLQSSKEETAQLQKELDSSKPSPLIEQTREKIRQLNLRLEELERNHPRPAAETQTEIQRLKEELSAARQQLTEIRQTLEELNKTFKQEEKKEVSSGRFAWGSGFLVVSSGMAAVLTWIVRKRLLRAAKTFSISSVADPQTATKDLSQPKTELREETNHESTPAMVLPPVVSVPAVFLKKAAQRALTEEEVGKILIVLDFPNTGLFRRKKLKIIRGLVRISSGSITPEAVSTLFERTGVRVEESRVGRLVERMKNAGPEKTTAFLLNGMDKRNGVNENGAQILIVNPSAKLPVEEVDLTHDHTLNGKPETSGDTGVHAPTAQSAETLPDVVLPKQDVKTSPFTFFPGGPLSFELSADKKTLTFIFASASSYRVLNEADSQGKPVRQEVKRIPISRQANGDYEWPGALRVEIQKDKIVVSLSGARSFIRKDQPGKSATVLIYQDADLTETLRLATEAEHISSNGKLTEDHHELKQNPEETSEIVSEPATSPEPDSDPFIEIHYGESSSAQSPATPLKPKKNWQMVLNIFGMGLIGSVLSFFLAQGAGTTSSGEKNKETSKNVPNWVVPEAPVAPVQESPKKNLQSLAGREPVIPYQSSEGKVGFTISSPVTGSLELSKGMAQAIGSSPKEKSDSGQMLYVKAGTPIAKVTDEELEIQIRAADKELQKIETEYRKAIGVPVETRRSDPTFEVPLEQRVFNARLLRIQLEHRRRALASIVASADGYVLLETLASNGHISKGAPLFTFIPANRFSARIRIPADRFRNEIMESDFNLAAEVRDKEGRLTPVQIQGITVEPFAEGSPYVDMTLNFFMPRVKDRFVEIPLAGLPSHVEWKVLPKLPQDVPVRYSHSSGMMTQGRVLARERFRIAAPPIVGRWTPEIPEMSWHAKGSHMGQNAGTQYLVDALKTMENFTARAEWLTAYYSPKGVREGASRGVPYIWTGNGAEYDLMWSLQKALAGVQQLKEQPALAGTRAAYDGIYMPIPELIYQPTQPGTTVGWQLSEAAHISDIEVPRLRDGKAPVGLGDVVIIRTAAGDFLGQVLNFNPHPPNKDGQDRSGMILLTDVLVSFDRDQVLGNGQVVDVLIPDASEQDELKNKLKEKPVSPRAARFAFQVTYKGNLPLLLESWLLHAENRPAGNPSLDLQQLLRLTLGEANSLVRIRATQHFISHFNRDQSFQDHLKEMILQKSRTEFSYREDVAQLALQYLKDQEDIISLINIFEAARSSARAGFAAQLAYQHIKALLESRPSSLALVIQRSRSQAGFREVAQNFFLSMVLAETRNELIQPTALQVLRSDFWDNSELIALSQALGRPRGNVLGHEALRRMALRKAANYHLGYGLELLKRELSYVVFPHLRDGVRTMELANEANKESLSVSANYDLERFVDPFILNAARNDYEEIAARLKEGMAPTFAVYDLSKIKGGVTQDPLFSSRDETGRRAMLQKMNPYDLARLLTMPQHALYFPEIVAILNQNSSGRFLIAQAYIDANDRTAQGAALLTAVETGDFSDRAVSDLMALAKKDQPESMQATTRNVYQIVFAKMHGRASGVNAQEKKNFYLNAMMRLTLPGKFELTSVLKQRQGPNEYWRRILTMAKISQGDFLRAARNEAERRSWIFSIQLAIEKFGIADLNPVVQGLLDTDFQNIEQLLNDRRFDAAQISEALRQAVDSGRLDAKHYQYLSENKDRLFSEIETGERKVIEAQSVTFYLFLPLIGFFSLIGGVYMIGFLLRIFRRWTNALRIFRAKEGDFDSFQKEVDKLIVAEGLNSALRSDSSKEDSRYADSDLKDTFDQWAVLLKKPDLERADYSRLLNLAQKARRDRKSLFRLDAGSLKEVDNQSYLLRILLNLTELSLKRIHMEATNFIEASAKPYDLKVKLSIVEFTNHMAELEQMADYLTEFRYALGAARALLKTTEPYQMTRLIHSPGETSEWFSLGLNKLGIGLFLGVRFLLLISLASLAAKLRLRQSINVIMQKAKGLDPKLYDDSVAEEAQKNVWEIFIPSQKVEDMSLSAVRAEWAKLGRRMALILTFYLVPTFFALNYLLGWGLIINVLGPYITLTAVIVFLGWFFHLHPMITMIFGSYIAYYKDHKLVLNAYAKRRQELLRQVGRAPVSPLELEHEWTTYARSQELDPAQPGSADIIVVVTSGAKDQEREIKKLLTPHVRRKVLFIPQTIAGSGGAYLSARAQLQKMYPNLQREQSHLPHNFHEARIVYLLAGGDSLDPFSLAKGADHRLLNIRLGREGRFMTTLEYALFNGYKAAQDLKRQSAGGEIVLSTDNFFDSPVYVTPKAISLLDTFASIDDILKQELGVIFDPYDHSVKKVLEEPDLKYLKRYTQRVRKRMRRYINPSNLGIRQLTSFSGNFVVSLDAAGYRAFERLIYGKKNYVSNGGEKTGKNGQNFHPGLYKFALKASEEYRNQFALDFTKDVLIPFLLAEQDEDLQDYIDTRTAGMPARLKLKYEQLGKIQTREAKARANQRQGLLRRNDEDEEAVNLSVIPGPIEIIHNPASSSQSRFWDLRKLSVWKEVFGNNGEVGHSLDAWISPSGNVYYGIQNPGELPGNTFAAHLVFDAEEGPLEINFVTGLDDNFLKHDSFRGIEGPKFLHRLVDRHGNWLFGEEEKEILKAPIFPTGTYDPATFSWLRQLEGDGKIYLPVEDRKDLNNRWRSMGWIFEHRSQLQTQPRSELRASIIEGLDAVQKMSFSTDVLARLVKASQSTEVEKILENHAESLLREMAKRKYPVEFLRPAVQKSYYIFQFDPDRHSLEFVKKLAGRLSGTASLVVIGKPHKNLAENRQLYLRITRGLRSEIGQGLVFVPKFDMPNWDLEEFVQTRLKELHLDKDDLLHLDETHLPAELLKGKYLEPVYLGAIPLAGRFLVVAGGVQGFSGAKELSLLEAFEAARVMASSA